MSHTNDTLIAGCLASDPTAIAALVRAHRPVGMRLATALLGGDEALAADAVQEAFVVLLGKLGDLRDADALVGWWRMLVRTQCTRILRKTRARVGLDGLAEPSANGTPHSALRIEETRALVRDAVAQLPPASRTTAELFYFEERSLAEVSGALGVPVGTVKRRLHDARQRLRDMFLGVPGRASDPADTSRPNELPVAPADLADDVGWFR